ncbi:MAG: hypothetical protein VZR56_04905 [Treponema sp.]|nr:hypothetical protein [Treponema sp.]
MKRKIISLIVAVFAMAITCAAAFADTVTFDKKNKGKEKDFVTMEFNSVEELAALCKKYPKNNAEVLLKADSPLTKSSSLSKLEFLKIVDCFPGAKQLDVNEFASLGVLNMGFSGNIFTKDMSIEFKYEGKSYSLGKISPVEANSVSFYDVKFNYEDFRNSDNLAEKIIQGVRKQQKNEFNSVDEFESLYKKHKNDSFAMKIPVWSRIRNEKDLEKLSKIIYGDSSKLKKDYKSCFDSDKTVVIESYFSGLSNTTVLVRIEAESPFFVMENALWEYERETNEKAGLGKITNAEVENERKSNEAAGYGRLTNAEVAKKLDAERTANDNAGFGRLTNAEVEKERKANEAAGKGRLTNAEVLEKQGGGDKACSVYFFDFEVKDKAEWNGNFPEGDSKKRMEKALQSRKQYEFNLLTTLKKLCKGHEKESISITIPVGAKMWNEKDMAELLGYLFVDKAKVQEYLEKFVLPELSKNKPIVFEHYVYDGKRFYSYWMYQSLAEQFEAEKEKERIANEAAGRGRFTNEEINHQLVGQLINQAKAYEQKKQWVLALNTYYDAMALDIDPSSKMEALYGYNKLASAIRDGNPGFGKYDVFSLVDEWKNILIDAEKFACTFCPYILEIGSSSDPWEIDYKTKTATYYTYVNEVENNRYSYVIGVIADGYKKARKNTWTDLPSEWPKYTVSGAYAFNYPESAKLDSSKHNIYKSERKNFNSFAVRFSFWDAYKMDTDYIVTDGGLALWEYEAVIVDKNGNYLSKAERCQVNMSVAFSGLSPKIMDMVNNGEAFPKIVACYLKYGYGEYKSVYNPTVNLLNEIIGKEEKNSLVCEQGPYKGNVRALVGTQFFTASKDKKIQFIENLKSLKVPVASLEAQENVEKVFKMRKE